VRLLLEGGARLAEPGEFTRRAYLNGRLDLLQVEAVAELIGARTERAVRLAARQLRGAVSADIMMLRERLLDLVAALEVELDFPDEAIVMSWPKALERTRELASSLEQLIIRARQGRAVQDGLSVMLAGAPNVGKSSLLNALLGTDRAIVSASPGTTRDLLDGTLTICGVQIRLIDGAGLATPRDAIDDEGMRRARRSLAESDLVLAVLDMSRPISPEDREVLALTEGKQRIIVANKSDLLPAWGERVAINCACSALTGAGLTKLVELLDRWVEEQTTADGEEGGVVASLRVLDKFAGAEAALSRAAEALGSAPVEAVLVDLREAQEKLEQALGIESDEAVLDRIFARFCIGK
jgi:tRNA modification GTPase